MVLVQKDPQNIKIGTTDVSAIYLGSTLIRPEGYNNDYLCFTANTAGSTVKLKKYQSAPSIGLETSTNKASWTSYNLGDTITLTNVGDKVYWRNANDSSTTFSTDSSSFYYFEMTGSISASGDTNYLINKNSTTTVGQYCFYRLFDGCASLTTAPKLPATTINNYCYQRTFRGCSSLTTAPSLPATTLGTYCYRYMFEGCSSLTQLPSLAATALKNYCYQYMFQSCSNIKLSTSQTGDYQTAYRIPASGSGSTGTNSIQYMFTSTGGTFTGTPTINKTYYTSNTVV